MLRIRCEGACFRGVSNKCLVLLRRGPLALWGVWPSDCGVSCLETVRLLVRLVSTKKVASYGAIYIPLDFVVHRTSLVIGTVISYR